jgi:hypothetical protein
MKKYFVSCKIRGIATCIVEADNEVQAIEKTKSSDLVKEWEVDEWDLYIVHFLENFEVTETDSF